MALDTCSYDDCWVLPPLDCWDWASELLFHTLEGAGAAAVFPETPGVQCSPSEASSGYLHDAIAPVSARRNKRQRMAAATTTPPSRRPATVCGDLQCLLAGLRDSSADAEGGADFRHDLNTTTAAETETRCSFVSGGGDGAGASSREEQQRGPSAQVLLPTPAAAAKGGDEEAKASAVVPPRRFPATVRAAAPLQLQKAAAGTAHAAARRDDRPRPVVDREHSFRAGAGAGAAATTAPASACHSLLSGEHAFEHVSGEDEKRGVGVLYPFAVVKPLGLDDGRMTTLDDVNQRILKRPARPVRHPVGPFAFGPAVSAHGLSLSGKAVVSLTKIRTRGNGTITIIRTR
ncbi:hypothetical protein ZEAMMB73_Zm00001d018227 [Zea mays]|uniref:Protein XRI1 n=1 Tax=Zea mays TaxID=4577 RepID=A0A1D6HLP8_MAIZE|nr:hypothetical protein ZEAMMB73_Zm00001d018227 [Zea mays]